MDNPPVLNSAGRMHLSVADSLRFLAETLRLTHGQSGLLKTATTKKLFTNPYAVSPHCLGGWVSTHDFPFCKGWILAHDGSNTFNYCSAIVSPDENLALCVFTNQGGPNGPGAKACQQVAKELLLQLGLPPQRHEDPKSRNR
jgi:hypothetical protein